MPGASPLWMAGLLTLWAASIAIWKPQPIHILELYQVEGGSHLVHALKGLETAEASQSLRHLQKHLQQVSPYTPVHRIRVRVVERKGGRPNQEGLRAILAIEADGRLERQRLEDALRGWNANPATPSQVISTDPHSDKRKRWATWKRDIAQHQLMLLSASADRPEIRKITSAASLASFQTTDGSSDHPVAMASPEQQWTHLLEEASSQIPAISLHANDLPSLPHQDSVACRSASWQPVAGPLRFDRLLAATATPLLLWAVYLCLLQLAKWRATRSRSPWTRSLESMGLLSFGRLEYSETSPDRALASSRNGNLSQATRWCLEISFYAFPVLLLTKAILNPPWGRFFFSEPIAALPKLLEWW